MVRSVMSRLRARRDNWIDPRKLVRWFTEAGPGAAIFEIRPFLGESSLWPTKAGGLGVLLEPAGVEIDGASRADLDFIAQACAAATRAMPEQCVAYHYQVVRRVEPQLAPLHEDEALALQQIERDEFLKETARFQEVRLYTALYLKSPAWEGITPAQRTKAKRRQCREIEMAAQLYSEILSSVVPVRVCTQSETTAFYSYLRTLERSKVRTKPLKTKDFAQSLGSAKVRFDYGEDCLRIGHRYVQPFSLGKRPAGTMPALWRDLYRIKGAEFVLCHIFRPESTSRMRGILAAREQAENFSAVSVGSAVMGALTPNPNPAAPVVNAASVATERNVKKIGKVLSILGDGEHSYGRYTLIGLVHSRDPEQVREAITNLERVFRVPGDAQIEEQDEARGALAAYLCCFPGNLANDTFYKLLRADHAANLTFPYRPFSGHPWSDDLHAPYTLLVETPEGVPFYLSTWYEGEGNFIVTGGKRRGKTLTVNAILAAEARQNGFLLVIDTGDSYSHNIVSQGGAAMKLTPKGPRLNPFRQPRTPENLDNITFLVETMIRKSGLTLQPGDNQRIRAKVEEIYWLPHQYQRLKYLQKRLPSELQPGLAPWVHGDERQGEADGAYAEVWDNVEDEFTLARRQAIDLKPVKATQHQHLRETFLFWVFSLFRGVMDDPANLGVPKTVVGEEIFTHIKDEQIMNELLLVAKTDARNLGRLIVIGHGIDDFGPHRQMIRAACPNTIFLGGAFDRQEYRRYFGVNTAQLDLIAGLHRGEMLYVIHGMNGFTKKLVLRVDPAMMARITTKPSEIRRRLDLIEQHGYLMGMRLFEKEIAREQSKDAKALSAAAPEQKENTA